MLRNKSYNNGRYSPGAIAVDRFAQYAHTEGQRYPESYRRTIQEVVKMSFMPGPLELCIIAVIVVLVFGVGKLSGIGKALGTSIKEFKETVKTDDDPQAER